MNLMGFCLSRWKLNIKPRLTLPISQPKAFSCLEWGRAFFVPPLQPIFLPLNCITSLGGDELSFSPSP
ncbi:hypothetical protein HYE67_001914 [Fusarium culmorum]|uniref:Uncharacterized protein n=1 Tax=Fusarium culmorum TaxID=5516 RepID=A0A2T4GXZ1_FUSCU|nr:hypothetical protein FCULG_00006098 [Fusarium culmorum]QPC59683.1 hypothetical protein HYE67_001914 [Fusarium culmorum]